ncbi:hypothetical protein NC652_037233 [Populus alba x Populus x berolinensis]|nr:hypothetical protein NC652_037233 [Populus alba x Populus x berolinensis]
MAIAVVSFFSGTPLYRNQRLGGSPLTRMCQVLVASFRKFRVEVPDDKSLLFETADHESAVMGSRKLDHTDQLSFFDKAAVETPSDRLKGSANQWKLCTVTQVEELKSIIRLLPVWATGIIFSAVYSQMGTLFVLQGNTMDLRMGKSFEIPSASLSLFDTISVIFWVPIYDRAIVPFARRFTGHKNGFTQLQRIAIGLVISIFAMLVAGTLELVRTPRGPSVFLIGCAEVFTFIGQLEFFYEQAPDAMRSLCSALSLTTAALGNYLSTFLVNIVTDMNTRHGKPGWIPDDLNHGHLHYFFWLLAVLSVLNLGVYLLVARWYTYKKAVVSRKACCRSGKKLWQKMITQTMGRWISKEIQLIRETGRNECCERLAYYGMSTNLVNYLGDRLNQGNVAAANSVTNWYGTCYVTPLIGAFLADSYLGRYWTIASFVIIYIVNLVPQNRFSNTTLRIMIVSRKTMTNCGMLCCTLHDRSWNWRIKPCVSSFDADQFDETDETERKRKSSFLIGFAFQSTSVRLLRLLHRSPSSITSASSSGLLYTIESLSHMQGNFRVMNVALLSSNAWALASSYQLCP